MIAQLVALNDGSSILIDKPILLVGRHPECDIQIDSRKVSRRHCCIALVADYLVVRDLGSTNGVRINGVRVTEGNLKSGDELTIGNHRYQVRWGAPDAANRSAPNRAAAPRPQRQTAPMEDEMLESCDEPIPLADPSPSPPMQPAESRSDRVSAPLPRAPRIIPDQLDLAPASEIVPPLPPPPPSV